MFTKQRGFTIVELLIVIVVIAILAAISIVTYSGVQQRSKLNTVQTELANFNKQAQLLKIDSTSNTFSVTDADFKHALTTAGLWSSTRNGTVKSYGYCAVASSYVLVSTAYLDPVVDGVKLYYTSESGLKDFQYNATTSGASTLDKICNQILPTKTYQQWAHSLT